MSIRFVNVRQRRDRQLSAFCDTATAIDAVSVRLLRPWIGIPGEVIDGRQPTFRGSLGKIHTHFLNKKRPRRVLGRT
jgi:hypothetical protein